MTIRLTKEHPKATISKDGNQNIDIEIISGVVNISLTNAGGKSLTIAFQPGSILKLDISEYVNIEFISRQNAEINYNLKE